jgi:cytoskeletal protein CcmA (bactofilin family)
MDKIVNIGQSIHIKGELTGNEDLTIEGKVEGKVFLKDHNLTVGANGKLVAEIQAKTVMVLGEITGNITADDKVEVAATGSMRGDIIAPRVVLADGAKFKGAIDMDRKSGGSASTSASSSASSSASRPMLDPVGAGAPSKGANL